MRGIVQLRTTIWYIAEEDIVSYHSIGCISYSIESLHSLLLELVQFVRPLSSQGTPYCSRYDSESQCNGSRDTQPKRGLAETKILSLLGFMSYVVRPHPVWLFLVVGDNRVQSTIRIVTGTREKPIPQRDRASHSINFETGVPLGH